MPAASSLVGSLQAKAQTEQVPFSYFFLLDGGTVDTLEALELLLGKIVGGQPLDLVGEVHDRNRPLAFHDVVVGRGLPVDLLLCRRHLDLGRGVAAEGECLDVLRPQDRAQAAAAKRSLLGGHDGGEPHLVLAGRPDDGGPVARDAVFGLEVGDRLRDRRAGEVRNRFDGDAVVTDMDGHELVALADDFDRAVAGVREVPGHEPAGVRGEQTVGQRRDAGAVHPPGEAHIRGLHRAGREHEPVVRAERVGVERDALVGQPRPDAATTDVAPLYRLDVRLRRALLVDVDREQRTATVEHTMPSGRRATKYWPLSYGERA